MVSQLTDSALPPEPRFCHQCGGNLLLQHIESEHRDRLVCESCGMIHYLNPRIVAAAIPELVDGTETRCLLMRRAIEPRRGAWTMPGGFVELGESTEEAAVREADEEVRLPLEISRLLGVYSRPAVGIVVVVYRARAMHEDAQAGEEALEVRWFTADTIPWHDLAFETTIHALRDWASAVGS